MILEVRKVKNNVDVLSYNNSQVFESQFMVKSDVFTVTASNGEIKFYENKKYLDFNGIKASLLLKHDLKTGEKIILAETSSGITLLNVLTLDLVLNSLPELSFRISYNIY